MAAPELGSFSAGSTGNKTILLNTGTFTPSLVEFWVSARAATNETDIRWSKGVADFVNSLQTATTIFNTTNDGTRVTNSKCIMHYRDNAGATLVLDGQLVSSSPGDFTVNMTTVDANYSIYFIAYP